jgi:hypothetical protein
MKTAFILAAIAVVATPAFAAVTVDSSDRTISTFNAPSALVTAGTTNPIFYDNTVTDSGGSDTTATSGSASTTTIIDTLSFGGSGSAHVTGHTGSPNDLHAISNFIVHITLDQPYDYTLSGKLTRLADGGDPYAYVQLYDKTNSATLYFHSHNSDTTDFTFNESGTLPAGSYFYSVNALAYGTDGGNAFATAAFENAYLTLYPQAVPEPASLSILAIGAASLLMRKRRQK